MRKIVLIIVLLICGCSDKYIVCNIKTANKQQNYQIDSQYTIYYRNNYVTKVNEKEMYSSYDKSVLDYYKNYLNMQALNFRKLYGDIDYQVSSNKNTVIYESTIDFDKINTKALIHNHYLDSSHIKKDKVTLIGIKNRYEQKGAICK